MEKISDLKAAYMREEDRQQPWGSTSSTQEHPAYRTNNAQTLLVDGKEIEIHDWDGPNDPDNPYAHA